MSIRGLVPPHLPHPYRKAIYKVAKCWEMAELAEVQVDPSILYRSSVLRRYRLLGPVLPLKSAPLWSVTEGFTIRKNAVPGGVP